LRASFPTLRVTCTVIKYCVEIDWGRTHPPDRRIPII
jgi:hypothetical protein